MFEKMEEKEEEEEEEGEEEEEKEDKEELSTLERTLPFKVAIQATKLQPPFLELYSKHSSNTCSLPAIWCYTKHMEIIKFRVQDGYEF